MRTVIVDEAVGEGGRGAPWVRIRFERVTAAAEERQLSQNTLLKALTLEALPSDRAGEFYEEAKPKKGGKQRAGSGSATNLGEAHRTMDVARKNGRPHPRRQRKLFGRKGC